MALTLVAQSRRMLMAIAGVALVVTAIAIASFSQAGDAFAAGPGCGKADGTYLAPGDFLITLDHDGSVVGQYSKTTQEVAFGAGDGETFSGNWACKGKDITIQQFRFYEKDGNRYIERGNGKATIDSLGNLSLTYTFHAFPEGASAADVRSGTGDVVEIPTLALGRVSTP